MWPYNLRQCQDVKGQGLKAKAKDKKIGFHAKAKD